MVLPALPTRKHKNIFSIINLLSVFYWCWKFTINDIKLYILSFPQKSLLDALKDILKKYDGESKKRENEELRRKRLAYVGISLQNVIASKTTVEDVKADKPKKQDEHGDSSEDEESESSNSYDSEPLYQLRARRQANVSYRFNDYDDMINEAILVRNR